MITLHAHKPYHFLLVHCNAYKDGVSVILSSQCVQALTHQYPNAKISILLHSSMQVFFQNNPHIHQIFCIDTSTQLIKELKHAHINISLSLVADKKSTMALFRAGIKVRIGVFSHLYSLLFNYKIKQKRTLGNKHEATYNFDLLRFLQCKQFIYPKLYLKLSDIAQAQHMLTQKFGEDSLLEKGCIILCPSHGLYGVGWKAKHFFTIANAIAPLHNVLLVAPAQEIESYKILLEQFPNLSYNNLFLQEQQEPQSFMQYNNHMAQMLALIHLSRLFIANNNTLLHAAAALDTNTFGILPHKNTLNPYRYAPISTQKKHIVCTPFGIFKPQDSYQDSTYGLNMESITPDIVLTILQAKFFPEEKLFTQLPSKLHQANTTDKEKENQTTPTQELNTESPIKQDEKVENVATLDIQDSGLTPHKTASIIDERG